MEKSWVKKSRYSREYDEGLAAFVDHGLAHGITCNGKLKCPCTRCCNCVYLEPDLLKEHLVINGMMKSYVVWTYHGEKRGPLPRHETVVDIRADDNENVLVDDIRGMVQDAFGFPDPNEDADGLEQEQSDVPNASASEFYKYAHDLGNPLYPGCNTHTTLSFIVKLWHIKALGGWSNNSFTLLLDLLREVLPKESTLPENFSQSKKIISGLGLNYNKIDACPYDCMLYWKESEKKEKCDICGTSRWKNHEIEDDKKTPAKILRHFPLKQRLQRLYLSSKTAADMRWHDEKRTKDGVLRHPADSPAWKHFDKINPTFAEENRNIRLGLASDGFNPFRTMSIAHSTWPVVLIPYNLPPWLCLKKPNMILSLLIPGPTSPGNDIDVYLRPLIDELKELWEEGLETYDSSKREVFKLRAGLLWTISDFPGYAMLSGWSTKGYKACPYCHENTCSERLPNCGKLCYMGHRRFLPLDHRFRKNKRWFDGNIEEREAPTPLTGKQILENLRNYQHTFGKIPKTDYSVKKPKKMKKKITKNAPPMPTMPNNWKKLSIFFELPYWSENLLKHNLDVMHIEKNICDNVVGTLLDLEGKSKDGLKARLDLMTMNIRHELHPKEHADKSKVYLPSACYSMDKSEKEMFCLILKSMKIPDGYASNISRCVNVKDRKISGLKSHDSHVIMQQFLPLAIRKTVPKTVSSALIELSTFFRELCSKTCRVEDFKCLHERIPLILCNLERIFPPSFFDIMVHLPIHLASEAMLGGPVHYRWMYPIERYLYTLKSYVRNKAYPEGSIAEGYLADECLTFCSRYLQNIETRLNRPVRYAEDTAIGGAEQFILTNIERKQMHNYVLFNDDSVARYVKQHKSYINLKYRKRKTDYEKQNIHKEQFSDWFKSHIKSMIEANSTLPERLDLLADFPYTHARRFTGYTINGYKFRTTNKERKATTQNSGVMVIASTPSYSSAKDKNPVSGEITYYGRLVDIIELTYRQGLKLVLFKCDWVDVGQRKGIKTDQLGFTLVNFTHLSASQKDEPYVLASQVKQVFYVEDPTEPGWHVVIKNKPRDTFDMSGGDNILLDSEPYGSQVQIGTREDDSTFNIVREDVVGAIVDAPFQAPCTRKRPSDGFIDDEEDEN